MVAAAGSFASISTLLGSPLLGAFLLMEASGLGAGMLEIVLLPGLVAAGVGSVVFIGLGTWTGLGTVSLAIPNLPVFSKPDAAEFGWALVIGVLAAPVGAGIRWLALFLRPHVERRMVLVTSLVGLAVAGLAIAFAAGLLLGSDGVPVTPLAIIAVAVAYVVSARLTPAPQTENQAGNQAEASAGVTETHPS